MNWQAIVVSALAVLVAYVAWRVYALDDEVRRLHQFAIDRAPPFDDSVLANALVTEEAGLYDPFSRAPDEVDLPETPPDLPEPLSEPAAPLVEPDLEDSVHDELPLPGDDVVDVLLEDEEAPPTPPREVEPARVVEVAGVVEGVEEVEAAATVSARTRKPKKKGREPA